MASDDLGTGRFEHLRVGYRFLDRLKNAELSRHRYREIDMERVYCN